MPSHLASRVSRACATFIARRFTNGHGASRRRALTRAGAALGLITLTAAVAGHAALTHRRASAPRASALMDEIDSLRVYGTNWFSPDPEGARIFVERLRLEPNRPYVLKVENGEDWGATVDSAAIYLNNVLVVSPQDFQQGTRFIAKEISLTGDDTLRIEHFPALDDRYISVTIVSPPIDTWQLYEQHLIIEEGDSAVLEDSFELPAELGPPYTVMIENGPWDHPRVESATLTLNGQTALAPADLGSNAVVEKPVTLTSENTFRLVTRGQLGGKVAIQFMARDTAAPQPVVDWPTDGEEIAAMEVDVEGYVFEHFPLRLTIDTVNTPLPGPGDYSWFSVRVPLRVEGENLIRVVAYDRSGRTGETTVRVIRNTGRPVLTVNSPSDNSITASTTTTVSGSAIDDDGVTVTANGIPLSVNGAGAFSGQVSLAEGANYIIVSAVDPAGNTSQTTRLVTRDTQAPVITVTEPAQGATIANASTPVRGTVQDATAVTLTVNGTSVPVQPNGSFEGTASLSPGPNTITVAATDAAGHTATATRNVTRGEATPPDPSTVAPVLTATGFTPLYDATQFLYTGTTPIQTGVAPGAIVPSRAAVVRGRVLTQAGAPLSGVDISILGQPQVGMTRSRADGWFDLALNGGGQMTVEYRRSGYLTAQRHVQVPWNDYAIADDVVLVPLDPAVTTINFSAPIQVARGSTVTDADGTRRATLFFEDSTVATMVLPNGSTQPLPTLSVRATEYTVDSAGRDALPGPLPPASAYTYAVELSADEAIAAGATEVRFSRPVTFYLENFVGFPVGAEVPVGYYDRKLARWIPVPNGRVVRIVSITSGRADLDLTGDGVAETGSALTALGITDEERQQLASLYAVNQSLWRARVSHFTPYDCNWPRLLPANAIPPLLNFVKRLIDRFKPCPRSGGSIIECENQVLGEAIPVSGTPWSLNYRSSSTVARSGRRMEIALSDATIPPSVFRITLRVEVAGRKFIQTFSPAPNLRHTFEWDGRDAYGRMVPGGAQAIARVGYVYMVAFAPAGGGASFGAPASSPIAFSLDSDRGLGTVWREYAVMLSSWDASAVGLGGWTLTPHHAYSFGAGILYHGDGSRRTHGAMQSLAVNRVAGTGVRALRGDGGLADTAAFSLPSGVTSGPDGSIYVADRYNNRVRRIRPDGVITTIAGSGWSDGGSTYGGFSGDGGPATQALMREPSSVALGPDGSLYIMDAGNYRVRRVDPNGIITTIAGNGVNGYSGDGGPATSAALRQWISQIAVGSDGSVYIADYRNSRIRRVAPDGRISTFAGGGSYLAFNEGGLATAAFLMSPIGVAVAPDGSVYISDQATHRIRRVTPDGIIRTVVSGSSYWGGYAGDGEPATGARINGPHSLAVAFDGTLYFHDRGNYRIRQVGPDGIIRTIGGTGVPGYSGDGGLAVEARFGWNLGLGVMPDGSLLIAEEDHHRIRKLNRIMPTNGAGSFTIAAEDGGALYDFDGYGRHLRTREGLTGSTLLSFQYDAAGRLSSITDADSLVTRVERDGQGRPTAIVAPFGQRTALTLDGAGYLASATNPANERVEPTHGSGGLLTSFRDRRGQLHEFEYDTRARLTRDDGPTGLFRTLAGVETDTTLTVTEQSALGRTWTYRMQRTGAGGMLSTRTDPAGLTTTSVSLPEVSDSTRLPGGTTLSIRYGSDPRFGGQAPFAKRVVARMPSGLTSTTTASRRATLLSSVNPFSIATLLDSVVTNGRVQTAQYTGSTRTLVTTSPEGRQSFTIFDTRGRATQERVAGLAATSFSYDAQGRLREELQSGRRTTYTYGADGRLASVSDPRLRTTRFFYDSAGRINRQESPDGRSVLFSYDPNGNLRSITPPGRPAHLFTYTPVNLTDTATPPLVGQPMATVFTYNADRALTRVRRADGSEHVYGYDTPGRLTSITTPGGIAQLAYDSITGQVRTLTALNGSTLTFSYDGLLPTREQWAGAVQGEVGLRYDANFAISSYTINGTDTVALQYDRDGLPTRVGRLTLGYHAQHGLLQSTALDSLTSSLSYDSLAQAQSYQVRFGASTLFNAGYQYDSLGRIRRIDETVQGVLRVLTFAYDTAGRLGEVRTDGVVTATYEYDANGNRLQVVRPGGTETGTYDAQDRVTAYGSATFGHLATGERSMRVAGTDTTRYEYDPFGRLLAVRQPSGTRIEFILDAQGRRVAKSVAGVRQRAFIYLGQLAPAAELDAQNQVVSRFVYGARVNVPDYIERSGVVYRVVTDHLGSVRLVVNVATGQIAQRLDYDEFGRIIQNSNPGFQPFGYAGGLYDDETGLLHFGLRDYDPHMGRWLQKDPISFVGRSSNLYSYVDNAPLTYSDPTGAIPWWVLPVAAGAGWGAFGGFTVSALLQAMTKGCVDYGQAAWDAAKGAVVGAVFGGLAAAQFARTVSQGSFFEGAHYSQKVLRQMGKADDLRHSFPRSVDGYADAYGTRTIIRGADGQLYVRLRLEGGYQSQGGFFEYIKNLAGRIDHRYLAPQ